MNLNQLRAVILNLGFAILLVETDYFFFCITIPQFLLPMHLLIVQEHFLAL